MSFENVYYREGVMPGGSTFYLDKEILDDGDINYLFQRGNLSPEEAFALADALYDDLGYGWKPYPENKPDINVEYDVTVNFNGDHILGQDFYQPNGVWHFYQHQYPVIAYRERPQPYGGGE